MSDSDPLRPLAPSPWLRPDTHAAMQAAYDREVAAGRDPAAAVAAACAVLLASVEVPRLAREGTQDDNAGASDAATAAEPGPAAPLGAASRRMDEGEAAELVAAITYALRFDARGKPRRGGFEFTADLAAEWLADHLQRSNFVLSRRRPGVPHRAG